MYMYVCFTDTLLPDLFCTQKVKKIAKTNKFENISNTNAINFYNLTKNMLLKSLLQNFIKLTFFVNVSHTFLVDDNKS